MDEGRGSKGGSRRDKEGREEGRSDLEKCDEREMGWGEGGERNMWVSQQEERNKNEGKGISKRRVGEEEEG